MSLSWHIAAIIDWALNHRFRGEADMRKWENVVNDPNQTSTGVFRITRSSRYDASWGVA
jgi:hypothetical protein